MNLLFRDAVFKGGFRPTVEAEDFETLLRGKLGLKNKYDSARLAIGRSLAEPAAPPPLLPSVARGKPIPGEMLFGSELDLWIAAVVTDGGLGLEASVDDFRGVVEAHWARGAVMLRDDLSEVGNDETRILARLADFLPAPSGAPGASSEPEHGTALRLKVGDVSTMFPEGQGVDFILNGPGTAPHIALMGKAGGGKTTTGLQIARQIVSAARIPFLFIDPKGEFVEGAKLTGHMERLPVPAQAIEVGQQPIPLDFLPDPGIGSTSVTQTAMQLRDSIALCCKAVGDVQSNELRLAIEDAIRTTGTRDLLVIRNQYAARLAAAGKSPDSVVSRLDELTALRVFAPTLPGKTFFSQSWVISLKALGSEELKRLVTLFILDALKAHVLSQPPSAVDGGFRTLRHLLIVDEARRILAQERYQSLVDLVRQGRSAGEVVMLLSQDPSDFEGKADDFMTQLGTVIAFACAQSQRGLRALQGPFGRKLQPQEFSDTHLPTGIAFVKLPGRQPERIRCWSPEK